MKYAVNSDRDYPAHIKEIPETGKYDTQLVQEHCRNVAALAEAKLKKVGLGRTAYLAGLLHDMGKFTNDFREYIIKAVNGEEVKRGSVNHSFAGVRYVLNRYHQKEADGYRRITAEIIAYAIGAHHGLFDCIDKDGQNGFIYRQTKDKIAYDEAVHNFLAECADVKELDNTFEEAVGELRSIIDNLKKICPYSKQAVSEMMFYWGVLARLVLSAVIDSDWEDTGNFQEGVNYHESFEQSTDWLKVLDKVVKQLDDLPNNSEIAKARRWISDQCAEMETSTAKIYRLSLPTGSGKTLTSLRFAIKNAVKGKRHMYFVMPLLSIIDQNAVEIRKYVGDDSLILEHHSNVVPDGDNYEEKIGSIKPALQINWHEPIIITTLVQFLLTCFGGKSSSIRRFHSLTDSIIVLDEVQTVPIKMLSLFNLVINFLSTIGQSIVVLCSATQPALRETEHPMIAGDELLELPDEIKRVFNRVHIKAEEPRSLEGIGTRVGELIQKVKSVLVVCNVKNEARNLYKITANISGNIRCFHLSANMCMAHRMKEIEKIINALEQIKLNPDTAPRVVCIATQVIEAGVDVSFESVIRLEAGMDNIVQAAGRCNRHGEIKEGAEVYIIRNMDNGLQRLPEIKMAQDATENLLAYLAEQKELDQELDSRESVDCYYRNLYKLQKVGYQDFTIQERTEPNAKSIYQLMAGNVGFRREDKKDDGFFLKQAQKTAGRLFTVFEENTTDVVVPYGDEGKNLIADLCSERAKYDASYARSLVRKARFYTVPVFEYQLKNLTEMEAIEEVTDLGVYILKEAYYNERFGVDYEGNSDNFLSM